MNTARQDESEGEGGGWPEVGVLATPATSESVETWLLAAGALAVTFASAPRDAGAPASGRRDDDIAHAVLEPAPGEIRLWDALTVVGLFPQGMRDAELAEALALAAAAVPAVAPAAAPAAAPVAADVAVAATLPDYRISRLADTVWERVWMRDYGPMRFGPRFVLCPSHIEPVAEEAVTLVLDPGLAFGSGTHPTTALCLEWLGRETGDTLTPLAGRRVVDYGCGSGVLAIAAALLGATEVYATDIDPQALDATRGNAAANGVLERLRIVSPQALGASGAPRCDLLLANILLGPLESLIEVFAALVVPGGRLVLSGVLESQIEPLRLRYNQAFDFAPERSRDGWALLEATRRSGASNGQSRHQH